MHKYWLAFTLGLQNEQTYRLDLFLRVFKYSFAVIFLSVIWIAVGRENQNSQLEPGVLIGYYLASATIFSLSNFHTWYVEEDIKLGYLSKFLLKPVSPYWMYFCQQAANSYIDMIIKAIVFIPLIFFINHQTISWPHIVLFMIFLPFIFYFSFTFFFTLSSLSFWFSDVYAIRWAWAGILRFISGVWAPIFLFPEFWQRVFFYLPFSHLVYTPSQILQNQMSISTGLQGLLILSSWCLLLTILKAFVWKKGLLAYESTGQ